MTDGIDPEMRVQIWLAKVEAKIDVAIAQHGARLDELDRRQTRTETCVRALEERPTLDPADIMDHETRLRLIEVRPVVSPRAMWTGVGTILAAVPVVLLLADRLYT